MSRKSKNLPRLTVLEKKGTAFEKFQKEKRIILEVEEFFISEEANPVGKWERIRDWLPFIEFINKLISFF